MSAMNDAHVMVTNCLATAHWTFSTFGRLDD